jgi:perosamine synthetase
MSATRRYFHEERGFNYRMTNLQAALGLAQLERIDEFLQARNQIMDWYRSAIHTSEQVRLNRVKNDSESAYWMVCLEVDWFDEANKATFVKALRDLGIDTRPYFCNVSAMPMYQREPAPVAKLKSRIGLNLPTYSEMTIAEVGRVASAVNDTLARLQP